VSPEEFDKIEDAPTAKDAWDTLQVNHQGSRMFPESRIKTLEDELSLFSMRMDEIVKAKNNGLALQAKSKAKKKLPNSQRMMTLVIMKMMSLMMSKWLSSSRTLEGF
jgi:hypothetical protein